MRAKSIEEVCLKVAWNSTMHSCFAVYQLPSPLALQDAWRLIRSSSHSGALMNDHTENAAAKWFSFRSSGEHLHVKI